MLLPFFIIGLACSHRLLNEPKGIETVLQSGSRVSWLSAFGIGKALLLVTASGMIAGGLTVMTVGMTSVFVPRI